eukprot:351280-Chlamydomonas_euryale.AAC.7
MLIHAAQLLSMLLERFPVGMAMQTPTCTPKVPHGDPIHAHKLLPQAPCCLHIKAQERSSCVASVAGAAAAA